MAEELNFDLVLKRIPVAFRREDGTLRKCVLLEMSGDVRAGYFEALQKFMLDSGQKVGDVQKGEDLNASHAREISMLLLSKCLFDVSDDGSLSDVSVAELGHFPAPVLDALNVHARRVSGLKIPKKNKETGEYEFPSEEEAGNA